MRVLIKEKVYQSVAAFYEAALEHHPTLDVQTVRNKEERLYHALLSLGETYYLYNPPRYIEEWQKAGYLDFICEDFHFAFQISVLPTGEMVVSVEDVCHSLLFHD